MGKKYITLRKNGTRFSFLPTGDVYEITKKGIMINQLSGNEIDGSCNQIYLRVYKDGKISATPLVGSNSPSTFSAMDDQLVWRGAFEGVAYRVTFLLAPSGTWFWQVQVAGAGQTVDVIYGQDIGNASKGAVRSNEAYISQYVDHHISHVDGSVVISSRQNQAQKGLFPLVEQGSLQQIVSYSTDGYQFFKRAYKESNVPAVLTEVRLADEVYQYEFAYTALQSAKLELSEEKTTLVFYGVAVADQAGAVSEPIIPRDQIRKEYDTLVIEEPVEPGKIFPKNFGRPLVGERFTQADLDALFPRQELVEKDGNQVLSFFTDQYHHVVLKEKEVAMERAHGHILLSGTDLTVDRPLMSTTTYMYGIFNSQIVLGNTSMNKLMSNSRNALNIMKQSGQRIYVKEGQQWRLLTMPSAYEMGLNSATWYYKFNDDLLKITTYAANDLREIRTVIESGQHKAYTFAVTNHLLMNENEEKPAFKLSRNENVLQITADKKSVIAADYPDLTYYINIDQPFEVTDERLFMNSASQQKLTVFLIENQSAATIVIQGSLEGAPFIEKAISLVQEEKDYVAFIDDLLNNFALRHPDKSVQKMNVLSRWYTHNMLVHYLSPHGLEQYGGAAWGTRDVSQGPTEFFLAVNRPEIIRSIIQHVYANQFKDNGNWPQWFMFDRYEKEKAEESHGDVIVWPMKIVADYLEKTRDFSILDTQIPYTIRKGFAKTKKTASLLDHIKKEISYIESNFLEGTSLSCYGDGDWDDTLQPYDSKLKKKMASSWTVALTYQVLNKLGILLREVDSEYGQHIENIVAGIKGDFEKYMLSDETIPGFVYMENPDQMERMIHPEDKKTGIDYRLLPMTRSMIAELLTVEQVEHHLAIIKEHLEFPDGVRLMNRPATYRGGVSTNFKRAEQAANFGREIGLQYVHAHIRFTEAMAKLGKTNETWKALNTINPILIKERVPNAELRQSNVYFSSSDGNFKTRYEAQENFDKLKSGQVGVKGGWRVYSSGPGIYLNQLLTNVLGIRETNEAMIFDPVLPADLDGLSMHYRILGKNAEIIFHLGEKQNIVVNGKEIGWYNEKNPYRKGGFVIETSSLKECLVENNTIEIYC